MGHSKLFHRSISEQFGFSGVPVYAINNHYLLSVLKRVNKMATMNFTMWLLNWLGYPLAGYAIFITWSSWKADVIFVLSGILLVVNIYYKIKRNNRDLKMKDLDIEERDKEIHPK
jgi:hypothetical protein